MACGFRTLNQRYRREEAKGLYGRFFEGLGIGRKRPYPSRSTLHPALWPTFWAASAPSPTFWFSVGIGKGTLAGAGGGGGGRQEKSGMVEFIHIVSVPDHWLPVGPSSTMTYSSCPAVTARASRG